MRQGCWGLTLCVRAGGQPVLLQMGLAAASLLQGGGETAQCVCRMGGSRPTNGDVEEVDPAAG